MDKFLLVLSLLICSIASNETNKTTHFNMFEKETNNSTFSNIFGMEPGNTTLSQMFEKETHVTALYNVFEKGENNSTVFKMFQTEAHNTTVSYMFEKEADNSTLSNVYETAAHNTTLYDLFEKEAHNTTVFKMMFETEADSTTLYDVFEKEAHNTTLYDVFEKEAHNTTLSNVFKKETNITTVFNMFETAPDNTTVFNTFENQTVNITVCKMFQKEAENTTVINMFEKKANNTTLFKMVQAKTDNTISFKNETFSFPSSGSVVRSISEYENQTTCEFTNLEEIIKPSALGKIYPLHKSKNMFVMKLTDSNLIAIEISKNYSRSLHKLTDFYFKLITFQYIKKLFHNVSSNIVFRKLFCNQLETYNISYIENTILPYFSDVGIYFTDRSTYCTGQFKRFVETKNNLLNNNDISVFLRNLTSCWKFVFFTNQVITKLSSGSLNSDKNIFFQVIDFSSIERYFFLLSKQHSCIEQFLAYSHLDGVYDNKTEGDYLWIGYIIEFNSKNNCLEIWSRCLYGYEKFQITDRNTAYAQVVIAAEVIVVNVFALYLFIQKHNRTPVTIILSALAVSDTICAILIALPVFIAYQQNFHHIAKVYGALYLYMFKYPHCAVYSIALELRYLFHFISVLMTLLLCLQKTVALLFPIRSRRYLNNKMSAITCVFILIFSITLFSPILNLAFYLEDVNGSCCRNSQYRDYYLHTYMYTYLVFNLCTCISCVVVVMCTIYMSCKLTILRSNLPWTDNAFVQKRNRISTIIVVLICIIYVISELAYVILIISYLLYFYISNDNYYIQMITFIRPFVNLILLVGFSLNFVVYIVMSRKLRQKVLLGIIKVTKCLR